MTDPMQDPTAQPDETTGLPASDAALAARPTAQISPGVDADGVLRSGDDSVPAADAAPAPADAAAAAPAAETAAAEAGEAADATAGAEGAEGADIAAGAESAPAPDAETAAATRDTDPVAAPQGEADTAAAAAPAPAAIPEMSPAACAARLAALFPALFKGQPKPLKLRIQADIQQRAPGLFTRRTLSAFLHRHTTTTAYLIALSQAKERFDLDGAPAGELANEHREAAVTELARRRAVHEERRAAESAARRAAEAQARQANVAADQARRERALLLRAFETSTLTRANFCALKRIDEAELDTMLATARQEAAQASFDQRPPRPADTARPPRPQGEHRPGPGGDRRDARGGPGRAGGPRPDGAPRRPPHGRPPR